jgi:hypothetical protein
VAVGIFLGEDRERREGEDFSGGDVFAGGEDFCGDEFSVVDDCSGGVVCDVDDLGGGDFGGVNCAGAEDGGLAFDSCAFAAPTILCPRGDLRVAGIVMMMMMMMTGKRKGRMIGSAESRR